MCQDLKMISQEHILKVTLVHDELASKNIPTY